MSILVTPQTRLLVQGITGAFGARHAQLSIDYGTQVVAGVTPGKGGQIFEHRGVKVPIFDTVADAVEGTVDLDAVRGAAEPTPHGPPSRRGRALSPPGQRIALAQDQAFSFMYPHLLDGWRSAGAEIIPFSPLADQSPDRAADAVWLPGGYPELHAGVLSSAQKFQGGLRTLAGRSVPIHGECGGYMVLGRGIEDARGVHHSMAGLLQIIFPSLHCAPRPQRKSLHARISGCLIIT